jgi:hypothetical protein
MVMELINIIIISIINVFSISISSTFFILHGYEHFVLEKVAKKGENEIDSPDSDPFIHEQMGHLLRKFYLNFIFLESSLIFYFTFWCSLFY